MISAQSRQVLYNDTIYLSVPNIVHHAGKLWPLKIGARDIIITIYIKDADVRILSRKIPKKLNLVSNSIGFSFSFIFH